MAVLQSEEEYGAAITETAADFQIPDGVDLLPGFFICPRREFAVRWQGETAQNNSEYDNFLNWILPMPGGNVMIFGLMINLTVGLLLIILGVLIGKKQKVTLLHDYHYKNVKQEELPAYSRLIGIGLLIIGAGICITGVFNMFESPLWWIPLAGGIAAGLILMNRAQKRYNGSWFS